MAFLDLIASMGSKLPSLFSAPAFGHDENEASSAYASADIPLPRPRPPGLGGLGMLGMMQPPQAPPQSFGAAPDMTSPGVFDRLNAGLLGFANSSAPVPAVGNLLGGLITGQRTDPAGMLQPPQAPPQSIGSPGLHSPSQTGVNALLDRLNAGVMGFANSRAPIPSVFNLLGGLATGQRTDPAGILQRLMQQRQQAVQPDQAAGAPPVVPPRVPPIAPQPVRAVPPYATFNDRFNAVFPSAAAPPLAAIMALKTSPAALKDAFIAKYGKAAFDAAMGPG